MKFSTSNHAISDIESSAVFVFCYDQELGATAKQLDESGKLSQLIERKALSGKLGEVTPVFAAEADAKIKTLYVVGCGKAEKFNENSFLKALGAVASTLKKMEIANAHLALDDLTLEGRTSHWTAQKATEQILVGQYSYDTTKSEKSPDPKLETITFLAQEAGLELAIDTGRCVAHGVNIARELGNLPGNVCTPTYLANMAEDLAAAYDEITTSVLEEEQMKELGMGCFMAVSQGSAQPGKMIVMEYKGGAEGQKPHVLVGKGLTFDSGGISLKPGQGMDEMKYDMCGAASVLGTMNAIAELKPSLNVVGVIAAAENMPSSKSIKPGDVVTSMAGKTVEILNTDAEGRLVLSDALTYVKKFDPASVIDIATLTGAVVIGLGHYATAVYSNKDDMQQQLLDAGLATWDRGWPMPLWEEYCAEIESPYADLQNLGKGRAGGSITAAAFLKAFADEYRWAHLDIAGTAWADRKGGASGRPVGMLTQYLLDRLN